MAFWVSVLVVLVIVFIVINLFKQTDEEKKKFKEFLANPKKSVALIAAAVIVIICIFAFSGSFGKSKIEGTWHNDDEGNMSLAENGVFFQNGESEGTWDVSGNKLTLSYDRNGRIDEFTYDLDSDTLIITRNDYSWIFNRID